MHREFSATYESDKEDSNDNECHCSYDDHDDKEYSRIEALEIILTLL